MNSSPKQIPVQPAPLEPGLANLARAMRGTKAVKIVTLGSSTMEGEGHIVAFPYRLEAALRQTYLDKHSNQRRMIDVINRGIGGEEAPSEFERMEGDVIAENPHLVIWQLGTNSVWQDPDNKPLPPPPRDETIAALRKGIDRLYENGDIDVILMDLQYVPAVLTPATCKAANDMVSAIAEVAFEKKVNLFRRFELMKAWHELEGTSFDTMVDPTDPDRLHDSDWATQRLVGALNQIIWAAIDKAQAAQAPRSS